MPSSGAGKQVLPLAPLWSRAQVPLFIPHLSIDERKGKGKEKGEYKKEGGIILGMSCFLLLVFVRS
jgi:hypothetical protein